MKKLNPYLMFSGNCKEALAFYKACLDGEIVSMQTFADSPVNVPDEDKHRIFNAEFRAENVFFMASDDLPNHQVSRGSNFALFVTFSKKEEQEKVFPNCRKAGKSPFRLKMGLGCSPINSAFNGC